jgi:hypothetical protein
MVENALLVTKALVSGLVYLAGRHLGSTDGASFGINLSVKYGTDLADLLKVPLPPQPVNHDLNRAARRAYLRATILFFRFRIEELSVPAPAAASAPTLSVARTLWKSLSGTADSMEQTWYVSAWHEFRKEFKLAESESYIVPEFADSVADLIPTNESHPRHLDASTASINSVRVQTTENEPELEAETVASTLRAILLSELEWAPMLRGLGRMPRDLREHIEKPVGPSPSLGAPVTWAELVQLCFLDELKGTRRDQIRARDAFLIVAAAQAARRREDLEEALLKAPWIDEEFQKKLGLAFKNIDLLTGMDTTLSNVDQKLGQLYDMLTRLYPPDATTAGDAPVDIAAFAGYVSWLSEEFQYLSSSHAAERSAKIDEVYVTLRAYPGGPDNLRGPDIPPPPSVDPETGYRLPRAFEERDSKKLYERASPPLQIEEALNQSSCCVILGDPGSGKTTFCRWMTWQLGRSISNKPGACDWIGMRLPVFVRAADFADSGARSLQAWLGSSVSSNQPKDPQSGVAISQPALNRLILRALKQRCAVVLLDGLDEVRDPKRRLEVLDEVDQIVKTYASDPATPGPDKGNRIIITSRIAGYERAALRSIHQLFTLEPLDDAGVERFCYRRLSSLYGPGDKEETQAANLTQALVEQLTAPSSNLRQIAGNPLMLSFLINLFREGEELPDVRAEVYQIITAQIQKQWRQRYGGFSERLFAGMCALAFELHSETSNGLIGEGRLLSRLDLVFDQHIPNAEQREEVAAAIREGAGLITEKGAHQWGFVHQNIQEYLAARHLTSQQNGVLPNLRSIASDPRWREVFLLALGHLSLKTDACDSSFEDVLLGLLDSESGEHFPAMAFRLLAAFPETKVVPNNALHRILIRTFAIFASSPQLDAIRVPMIAGTRWLLAQRRDYSIGVLETILDEAISSNEMSRVTAALTLMREADFLTPILAEALLRARAHDRAEWGWAVHDTIDAFAAHQVLLRQKIPHVDNTEARHLLGPNLIGELRRNGVTEENFRVSYDSRRSTPEDRVHSASWFPTSLSWPAEILEERCARNVSWFRLLIVLFNGVGNFGLRDIQKKIEARQARLLDMNLDVEDAREMAVELDVLLLPELHHLRSLAPRFYPSLATRVSPLVSMVLQALQNQEAPDSLAPELWKRWDSPIATLEERVDSLLALIAIGENVDAALVALEPGGDPFFLGVRREIAVRLHGLTDALARSAPLLTRLLERAPQASAFPDIGDCLTALNRMLAELGLPLLDSRVALRAAQESSRPFRIADYWSFLLRGGAPEPKAALAHSLDEVGRDITAAALNESIRVGVLPGSGPLILFPRNVDEQILNVLVWATELPAEWALIREFAYSVAAPAVSDPLLKALFTHLSTPTGEIGDPVPLTSPAEDSSRFWQFWGRLWIKRMGADPQPPVEMDIRYLALWAEHMLRERQDSTLWQERAFESASQIPDPPERAWMWLRLSRYQLPGERAPALEYALQATQQIKSEVVRAQLLARMKTFLAGHPQLESRRRALAQQITQAEFRGAALAQYGAVLNAQERSLFLQPPDIVPWAIATLAARLRDAMETVLPSDKSVSPTGAEQLPGSGAILLSPDKVEALQASISSGNLDILSRVYPAGPEGTTFIYRLAENQNSPEQVTHWANLVRVESGDWTVEAVRSLFALMRGDDSGLRARAAITLYGRQSGRERRASRMGPDVIEEIASVAGNTSEFGVALSAQWALGRIIFDDERLLRSWVMAISDEPKLSAAARSIVGAIRFADRASLEFMYETLQENEPAAKVVLHSLIAMSLEGWKPRRDFLDRIDWVIRNASNETRVAALCTVGFLASSEEFSLTFDYCTAIPALTASAIQTVGRTLQRQPDRSREDLWKPRLATFCAAAESEVRIAAAEAWVRASYSFEELTLLLSDPEERLTAYTRACQDADFATSTATASIQRCADALVEEQSLVLPLLRRLTTALESKETRGPYWAPNTTPGLICLSAAIAERVPDRFLALFPRNLLALLSIAAREHTTFVGRRDALWLLSLSGADRMSAEAISSATRDVPDVQRAALGAVHRLRSVDPMVLGILLEEMRSVDSARVYIAMKLLLRLALSAETNLGLTRWRPRIKKAIEELTSGPGRPVVTIDWNSSGLAWDYRQRCLGDLRELAVDGLLSLSSISAATDRDKLRSARLRYRNGTDRLDLQIPDVSPGPDFLPFQTQWAGAHKIATVELRWRQKLQLAGTLADGDRVSLIDLLSAAAGAQKPDQ